MFAYETSLCGNNTSIAQKALGKCIGILALYISDNIMYEIYIYIYIYNVVFVGGCPGWIAGTVEAGRGLREEATTAPRKRSTTAERGINAYTHTRPCTENDDDDDVTTVETADRRRRAYKHYDGGTTAAPDVYNAYVAAHARRDDDRPPHRRRRRHQSPLPTVVRRLRQQKWRDDRRTCTAACMCNKSKDRRRRSSSGISSSPALRPFFPIIASLLSFSLNLHLYLSLHLPAAAARKMLPRTYTRILLLPVCRDYTCLALPRRGRTKIATDRCTTDSAAPAPRRRGYVLASRPHEGIH